MDFKAAQNFWVEKDKAGKKMPEDELRSAMEAYVNAHTTMALATGTGDFVRNTPLEYVWSQGAFWVLSEGGLKFVGLEKNAHVCIAIFDPLEKGCHGLQVMGKAEIIAPESETYAAFLNYRHINPAVFKNMPYPMPMLRIVPVSADYLDFSLAAKGYSRRQHYEFPTL